MEEGVVRQYGLVVLVVGEDGRDIHVVWRLRRMVVDIIVGGGVVVEGEVGEVEFGFGAVEFAGGGVVGEGGVVGGVEGAEPEAGPTVGLADLGHPFAPCPLADALVGAAGVFRASLPSHAPFP